MLLTGPNTLRALLRNVVRRTASATIAGSLLCAGALADTPAPEDQAVYTVPPGEGRIDEFLGCEAADGQFTYVGVTERDMPWRVAIGMPRNSPRFGGRKEARQVAIDAIREWERAIQTRLPWFVLEFVKKDPKAQVQIKWKRRMGGSAQGRGGPTCWEEGGELRAGGRIEVAVKACPTCSPLDIKEVGTLMAHEFGHVLGLGHCLECDSAMNYSWQTIGRAFVTETDVEAVVRRFSASPSPRSE